MLHVLKVPQWSIFNRELDAATQMWFVMEQTTKLKLKTQFWDTSKCDNTHTLTTTTTGSKNSQKEVNNQSDNQNQYSIPPKVSSLQDLGLV